MSGKTVNRGLVYPDPTDPVPNWPSTNELNNDLLDSLFSASKFQDYTPSLEFSDGSPNVGDEGKLLGKFYKIFDIYHFYIWMFMDGSGVDMGTGSIRLTLPADIHSLYEVSNRGSCIGGGYWQDSDNGFSRTPLSTIISGNGANVVFFVMANNTNSGAGTLRGNNPTEMVAGDQLEVYGKFKAASA